MEKLRRSILPDLTELKIGGRNIKQFYRNLQCYITVNKNQHNNKILSYKITLPAVNRKEYNKLCINLVNTLF